MHLNPFIICIRQEIVMVITQGIEMSLLKNHTDNNYLINKPNQLSIKYYNLFPYNILNFEDYFTFKFKIVCSVHNKYYL